MDGEKLKNNCYSLEDLRKYLTEKAKKHKSLKFYSQLSRIENIVKTKALYLSDGSNWNDVEDRNSFNSSNSSQKNFGICFSFSISENIAMWMLYGGVNKNGAMLKLSPQDIVEAISTLESLEIGYFKQNEFIKTTVVTKEHFKVTLIDVVYYAREEQGKCTIKRGDERCKDISTRTIDGIKYAKKQYPWFYENECRLIVSVSKNYIKEMEKSTTIKFPIDNLSEKKRDKVVLAPDFEGSSLYEKSKMSGKVSWNLLANYQYKCYKACRDRQKDT